MVIGSGAVIAYGLFAQGGGSSSDVPGLTPVVGLSSAAVASAPHMNSEARSLIISTGTANASITGGLESSLVSVQDHACDDGILFLFGENGNGNFEAEVINRTPGWAQLSFDNDHSVIAEANQRVVLNVPSDWDGHFTSAGEYFSEASGKSRSRIKNDTNIDALCSNNVHYSGVRG
jgi:hypothetical protein